MLLWPRPYPGLASIYVLRVARFLFRLEFQAPARVISDAFDFLFFLCLRPKRQYRCCVFAVFLGRTTVFYGNFILFPVPKLSDTKGYRPLRCFFRFEHYTGFATQTWKCFGTVFFLRSAKTWYCFKFAFFCFLAKALCREFAWQTYGEVTVADPLINAHASFLLYSFFIEPRRKFGPVLAFCVCQWHFSFLGTVFNFSTDGAVWNSAQKVSVQFVF